MSRLLVLWVMLLGGSLASAAEEPVPEVAAREAISPELIRKAIAKSIPLLERGATVSAEERKCFTCHNQALPVLALTAVSQRGFDVNPDVLKQQLTHTWNHLERGLKQYQAGKGQGGQVLTAGYALWALDIGGWPKDETTAAVTHYLLAYQRDQDHWTGSSRRPPTAGSGFTSTYVALRALAAYGTNEQQAAIAARRQSVAKWVLETKPLETEDRVFQLRSLPYLDADPAEIQAAVDALLAAQLPGGGWSQKSDLPADAYATATVLAALREVGQLPADHNAIQAGGRYLLDAQLEDGSWHVVTRAKPIQDYYEAGFPHDEDQFISISATSWATIALAQLLPREVKSPD